MNPQWALRLWEVVILGTLRLIQAQENADAPLEQQQTQEGHNYMNYGALYNFTDGICIPTVRDWSRDKAYFNTWLQVHSGNDKVCIQCSTDAIRVSCIRRKETKKSDSDLHGDLCTKDGRVLIAISKDLTLPPVNLTTVHLKDGHGAECSPTVASVDTVLFEFALTECGTSQRLDGVDVVYETDVLAQFEILDGALGSVSRDSPFRLHVQCSYKGSQESELQLKPRVYTLSPPLPATETGILLLELRIARDAAYRSWYVASDYPILSVLREPVFVEVRVLNRNDPSLVLVLNECWASPTAEPYSQLQWKLLVNRCPFTGDNYKSRLLPLDAASHLRFPTHHKRFVVSTFTFWERVSGRPLSGEVYFHCSAEVCSPSSRENCTASCSPMRRRSTNDQPGTLVTTGPIIFLEDGERLSAGIQQEEKDAAVDSPSHVLPGVAVGVALLSVALLVATVAVWKMDVAHRVGSECRSMEL
ncbi:zona pellucida sperm-binding protein 4-like [Heterodontus francisci]|uniref:zona pellucida sperm-binding protein 4-like n=1 Tax=Heterodontus francisci TaxID=7792 RepID=UPI00355BA14E